MVPCHEVMKLLAFVQEFGANIKKLRSMQDIIFAETLYDGIFSGTLQEGIISGALQEGIFSGNL